MDKSRLILPTSCIFALSLLLSCPLRAMQQRVAPMDCDDSEELDRTRSEGVGDKFQEIMLDAHLQNGLFMLEEATVIMNHIQIRLGFLDNNPAQRTASNTFEIETMCYNLGRLSSGIEDISRKPVAGAFKHRLVKSNFFAKVQAIQEGARAFNTASRDLMSGAEHMKLHLLRLERTYNLNPPVSAEDRAWWVRQLNNLRTYFGFHVFNDPNVSPEEKANLRKALLRWQSLITRN